jgi:hypothetical protein
VGPAGFSWGLAFGGLAVDVVPGGVVVALLGDTRDVEDAVDATVAAEVEAVPGRWPVALTGGQGHGAGAAPAGELGLAGEAERVTDLDQQRRGGDRADPSLVTKRGAVGVEQLVDPTFERSDLAAGSPVLVDER